MKLHRHYVDVAAIQNVRSNSEVFHVCVYTQASVMAQGVDIEETFPCIASRQQHHQNIPAQSCTGYYHLHLTILLVDNLLFTLTTRFDAQSVE